MKFSRRNYLRILGTTTLAGLSLSLLPRIAPNAALAQGFLQSEEREPLTADVLCAQLYVKTPEEEAFVTRCVELRDQGVLPNRLLYTAYRYAVKKNKSRRYYYFRIVILRLCEDNDIPL